MEAADLKPVVERVADRRVARELLVDEIELALRLPHAGDEVLVRVSVSEVEKIAADGDAAARGGIAGSRQKPPAAPDLYREQIRHAVGVDVAAVVGFEPFAREDHLDIAVGVRYRVLLGKRHHHVLLHRDILARLRLYLERRSEDRALPGGILDERIDEAVVGGRPAVHVGIARRSGESARLGRVSAALGQDDGVRVDFAGAEAAGVDVSGVRLYGIVPGLHELHDVAKCAVGLDRADAETVRHHVRARDLVGKRVAVRPVRIDIEPLGRLNGEVPFVEVRAAVLVVDRKRDRLVAGRGELGLVRAPHGVVRRGHGAGLGRIPCHSEVVRLVHPDRVGDVPVDGDLLVLRERDDVRRRKAGRAVERYSDVRLDRVELGIDVEDLAVGRALDVVVAELDALGVLRLGDDLGVQGVARVRRAVHVGHADVHRVDAAAEGHVDVFVRALAELDVLEDERTQRPEIACGDTLRAGRALEPQPDGERHLGGNGELDVERSGSLALPEAYVAVRVRRRVERLDGDVGLLVDGNGDAVLGPPLVLGQGGLPPAVIVAVGHAALPADDLLAQHPVVEKRLDHVLVEHLHGHLPVADRREHEVRRHAPRARGTDSNAGVDQHAARIVERPLDDEKSVGELGGVVAANPVDQTLVRLRQEPAVGRHVERVEPERNRVVGGDRRRQHRVVRDGIAADVHAPSGLSARRDVLADDGDGHGRVAVDDLRLVVRLLAAEDDLELRLAVSVEQGHVKRLGAGRSRSRDENADSGRLAVRADDLGARDAVRRGLVERFDERIHVLSVALREPNGQLHRVALGIGKIRAVWRRRDGARQTDLGGDRYDDLLALRTSDRDLGR